MKIIGICGGSGSGKGTVGKLFNKENIPVIDTDALYHELTSADSPCLRELVALFGDSIVVSGALDRRALANIVFATGAEERRAQLNTVTHRHILDRAREILSQYEKDGFSYAAVDAPLLFESGFNKECDVIVCVVSPKEQRIARIMLRDGITREAAEHRIDAQLSDSFIIENSDFVIYNDATEEDLARAVCDVIRKLKEK